MGGVPEVDDAVLAARDPGEVEPEVLEVEGLVAGGLGHESAVLPELDGCDVRTSTG